MNQNFKQSRFTFSIIKRLGNLNDATLVKRGRPLVTMLITMAGLVGWRSNLSLVKVIIVFSSNCSRIAKEQSIKGLVQQLKVAQVLLQQSMGGYKVPNVTLLGQRVSRNGQGLPRKWIPRIHRQHLRQGSHLHFKLWMTLFGLYRVLSFVGKLNYKSITDGSDRDYSFLLGEYSSFVCHVFRPLLLKFPGIRSAKVFFTGMSGKPLKAAKMLKGKPFIISSSTPSARGMEGEMRNKSSHFSILSTSPAGILLSVIVWFRPENDMLREYLFNYCRMTDNIWVINRMEEWKKLLPKNIFVDAKPGVLGKLAELPEAAGKIRVVAMVDCWTQWVMDPLFRAIAAILRVIPQDGTEDQDRPYRELWSRHPNGPFHCYDLSSATDRLPLIFQKALLSSVFGSWFAELWGVLLVGRPYETVVETGNPLSPIEKRKLYYGQGQPMGAKSSFHMMAFFHHSVVQWAAHRRHVRPGEWFSSYAIVGDDVVISHDIVAEEYLKIMDELGVKVGLHKSLVSHGRKVGRIRQLCSEFIKRTYYSPRPSKGGKSQEQLPFYYDVSALPITQWFMATKVLASAIDLGRRYNLSLAQFLSLFGFGYRAKARLMAKFPTLGRRLRHKILAYYSPDGVAPLPLMEWISMRSISSRYKVTVPKVRLLLSTVIKSMAKEILRSLESPTFVELSKKAMEYATVKRDREYYGTTSRVPGPQRVRNHNPDDRPILHYQGARYNLGPFDYEVDMQNKATVKGYIPTRLRSGIPIFWEWEEYLEARKSFPGFPFFFEVEEPPFITGIKADAPHAPVAEWEKKQIPRLNHFEDIFSLENIPKVGWRKFVELDEDGNMVYNSEWNSIDKVAQMTMELNNLQYILDMLIEAVYREAYLDVATDIRDIKEELTAMIETNLDIHTVAEAGNQLLLVWNKVRDLDDRISGLALPKEIYSRVEHEIRVRESKLVKSWEQMVAPMRTTKSHK